MFDVRYTHHITIHIHTARKPPYISLLTLFSSVYVCIYVYVYLSVYGRDISLFSLSVIILYTLCTISYMYRSLEHSTILYEAPDLSSLLRVAWNKVDNNYIATVQTHSPKTVVLDIRYTQPNPYTTTPSYPIQQYHLHLSSTNKPCKQTIFPSSLPSSPSSLPSSPFLSFYPL
jgi:hypothetical protein